MNIHQKKKIRSLILALVLLLAAGICVAWFIWSVPKSAVVPLTGESECCAGLERMNVSGSDWVSVADNGQLELLLRPDTAEVAVRELDSGAVFYTNPQDRDEDTIARGTSISLLSSQLTVSCADAKNNIAEYNSYDWAVKNGQMSYWALDDGLKVFYLMREQLGQSILPDVATIDDFNNVLLPMIATSKDRQKVKEGYRPILLEPDKLTDEERDGIVTVYGNTPFMPLTADERETYIAKYPLLAEVGNCFVLNATGFKVKSLEKILTQSGVTMELKNQLEEKVGVVHEEQMTITASLEYRLENGELVVTAPAADVTCTEGSRVLNVRVLPMMGASQISREGYAVLPDGSGALIRFGEERRAIMSVSKSVYGANPSLTNRTSVAKSQPVMLPVYGIISGDQGVMALLDDGASQANLNLTLAGSVHQYNTLYPEFTITANTQITLQAVASDTAVRTYQQNRYMGDFAVRYFFLTGDEASYSGMASKLRRHWTDSGVFRDRCEADSYSLMCELLMGIDTTQSLLGFPVERVTAATTFQQAEDILKRLAETGVDRMTVRLNGWQAGGTNHGLQTSAKAERALGGERGMQSLLTAAAELNVEVYPGFGNATADTEKAGWFSGFSTKRDVLQTLRREPSRSYHYALPTGILDRSQQMRFLLTDAKKTEIAEAYARSLQEKQYNIAFDEMGALIATDFNPEQPVSRNEAQACDERLLALLSEGRKAMGDSVNAYAYPYVDYVANLPAESSLLNIYDESIPFVQMVLHGYRRYGIEYLNIADMSREDMILHLLETGSEPAFLWIAAEDELLRDSDYQDKYSLNYTAWLENAAEMYRQAAEVLAPLSGQTMTSHEWLTDRVACVGYEDGTYIYINYGDRTYITGSVSIPAHGWTVRKGRGQ